MKEFNVIVWDIQEMGEREKLNAFLDGLSREVTQKLHQSGVRSFLEVISIVKHLANYDTSARR